ncbi:MAG: type VII secretion integral membrane protein EccD [Mycobacterium sp.]|uniref:type VII secretion integral membrane protein EccD n=1 Tax=Mycobacterium sp. TaxID=1785 RepID=UPI00260306D5|nr:type VII secretion integral membrane protein EccD [Mycobacterium sp.]MDI3313403.1 type VII secretion integral membrane protein EccD [Mycobacterium sp.]
MMSGVAMPIVRVAVLTENRLTEMALPAEVPLREILPAVQHLAAPASDEDGHDGAPVRLSLAPIGGAPFSLDASLDTVGVVDGDLLVLQPLPPGPAAPGIVEDIADAAVIFSAARRKPWGTAHIQRCALGAVLSLVIAATGLATAYRVITGAPVALYATSAIAAATVLAALVSQLRSPRTGVALSAAALVPVAAACALAVPGGFGPANLMLGAAGFSAWSVISVVLPRRGDEHAIGFFTATAVLGAGVLLAAGAASLWQLSLVSLGCGLIVAALLLTVEAAQLSALWARFPLPVIPAPGDPTPSAPPLRVLEDLPRRVRISDAHQVGFIAGGVLLSVLGSTAIAARPESLSGWGWYVVAAAGLGFLLRARVWDSAACKIWLLAQPGLTMGALLVLYAATAHYTAAFWTLAAFAGVVLAWVVAALSPTVASPDSYSLPIRRLVGFLAAGIDGSLIPVMAYVVGLYGWLLNR